MLARRLALLVPLAVALSGCFHLSSVISVRPDGSATVRDSVAFSGFMAVAMAEAREAGEDADLFDRGAAEERARALGDGVRLERFETTEAGYVAVYAAPDIRTVRYTAPDLETGSSDTTPASSDSEVDFRFLFEPGDPATLRVLVQKPTPAKRTEPSPGLGGDLPDTEAVLDEMGALSSMFGDARMVVSLRVEGDVVETTADYADGPDVTLFDLSFAALFENAEALAQIGQGGASSRAAYDALDGVEGVRLQKPGTVRVRFR